MTNEELNNLKKDELKLFESLKCCNYQAAVHNVIGLVLILQARVSSLENQIKELYGKEKEN